MNATTQPSSENNVHPLEEIIRDYHGKKSFAVKILDLLLEKGMDAKGYLEGGIIAGQSVSSAILELLQLDLRGQYKDFDVFYTHQSKLIDSTVTRPFNPKDVANPLTAQIEPVYCSYGGFTGFETIDKGKYQIRDSQTVGKMNYILFNIHRYKETDQMEETATTLLQGFDINAVKVALFRDPKTTLPKLVVCDEYMDFIKTGTLKAVTAITPLRTLLRLLKKQHELKAASLDEVSFNTLLSIYHKQTQNLSHNDPEGPYSLKGSVVSDIFLCQHPKKVRANFSNYFTLAEMPQERVDFQIANHTRFTQFLVRRDIQLPAIKESWPD
ncbi:hypothetical protein [Reinekea sp. G2M2-21]|uniref:hypothetical protein n=1 Tax=Reinekea sp. G2M2-21 TaxID=2788942 RepID=UPI0018AA83F6|nr:hypothetical protein [Reinekea sp. G2M2-21]